MFNNTPLLSDIGMVYCTKSTINKVSPLVGHTCNIYVNSVIPEKCTPVDGITFIYDGYVKTLYLNSPLLEGDSIEEKDIITVNENDTFDYVANVMINKSINRVPVVDENNFLKGIICRYDIIKAMYN